MAELFGHFNALIVGRRHQHHLARLEPGEHVGFQREPALSQDSIAIAVVDQVLRRLGYLPRWLALLLAPCIDSLGCTFVATMTGAGNRYTAPIRVSLYAHPSMSSHVCKVLGRYWHMWQLKAPPARDIECWTGSETVSECSSSETDVGLDLGLSLNTDADFARDYGADIDFDLDIDFATALFPSF